MGRRLTQFLRISSALLIASLSGAQVGPPSQTPIFVNRLFGLPCEAPNTVGASSGSFTAGQTSFTVTTSAAIIANNLVVAVPIFVSSSGTNYSVTSISDGTNTYTNATRQSDVATGVLIGEMWYKSGAAAVATSATITVNFSPAAVLPDQFIFNSGQSCKVVAASALDQTAHNDHLAVGATSSISCGPTGTLAQAKEVALGYAQFVNTVTGPSPSAPFSQSSANIDWDITNATSALTYTSTVSSAGDEALCLLATFKHT